MEAMEVVKGVRFWIHFEDKDEENYCKEVLNLLLKLISVKFFSKSSR
jgi:hypothetical protein